MPLRLINVEVAAAESAVSTALAAAKQPQTTLTTAELNAARSDLAADRAAADVRRDDLIANYHEIAQLRAQLASAREQADAAAVASLEGQLATALTDRTTLAAQLTAAEDQVGMRHAQTVGDLGTAASYTHLEPTSPIALFPVRLETRYFAEDADHFSLWVRIFPDDVHVDERQPLMSAAEHAAAERYWQARLAGGPDADATLSGWQVLCERFGEARAADVAGALDPFGRSGRFESGDESGSPPPIPSVAVSPDGWTDPVRARALPDRWAVAGYRGEHRVLLGWSGPVRPDLRLSPVAGAPGDELLAGPDADALDAGIEWITDFTAAENAGMAVRLTVGTTIARSMDRLVVFGVNATDDSSAGADALAHLLTSHAATGLHFVPPGRPTNNTATTRSDYRARAADHADSHARFVANSPTSPGDASQARVARVLGVDPAVFRHALHRADRRERGVEAMHTALWLTSVGALLRDHIEVVTSWDDQDFVRTLFVDHVRPAGAFPVLRVGAQPYGILPAVSLARWRPRPGPARQREVINLLQSLRQIWADRVGRVPRVFDTSDPQRGLLEALSQAPSGEVAEGRHVFWSPVVRALDMQLRMTGFWDAIAPQLQSGPVDLLATHGGARLSDRQSQVFGAQTEVLDLVGSFPLVTSQADKDVPLAQNYIARLAQHPPWSEVTNFQVVGAGERPVLYRLLAGAYIQQAFIDQASLYYPYFFSSLSTLGGLPVGELETLCSSAIDSLTYRLDAWISAVAGHRLAEARAIQSTGVHIGGFGWVEGLEPPGTPPMPFPPTVDDPESAGFMHLRSPGQAKTAAILHGAHLAHAEHDSAETLSMQLDSDRVRLARWLLDGVRQGQSLGALLGYRLERLLVAASLGQHIYELRRAVPLRVSQADVSDTTGATLNVVDGLQVLRLAETDELAALIGVDTVSDIDPALTAVGEALDAVSDLLLAEGVHQATDGNPHRAGAAFDAMADGSSPVPEVDVVATDRAAHPLGQRLAVLLPVTATTGWEGDETRVRAEAEPRLNAWAAAMFGDPKHIRFAATFTHAGGTVEDRAYALDAFDVCALDLVYLTARSFERAPLVAALAILLRKSGPDGDGRFTGSVDVHGSDPDAAAGERPLDEVLAQAAELAEVLRTGRSLDAADLRLAGTGTGFDDVELAARVAAVDSRFAEIDAAFRADPTELTAWWRAALVAGAVDPDAAQGIPAIEAALTDRSARRQSTDTTGSADGTSDAIRALLGSDFVVVPTFLATNASELDAAFGDQSALLDGDVTVAKRWLEDHARVRPACDPLDLALTIAESTGAPATLEVAQLPHVGGIGWVGESFPDHGVAPRLSLVAHRPFTMSFGAGAVAGLLVDGWNDAVPARTSITGVSFQYDAPKTRAPQVVLVVPHPDPDRDWEFEDVEETVLETLDLAKMRGVEIDDLPPLGHYLPAVFFIQGMDPEWTV